MPAVCGDCDPRFRQGPSWVTVRGPQGASTVNSHGLWPDAHIRNRPTERQMKRMGDLLPDNSSTQTMNEMNQTANRMSAHLLASVAADLSEGLS